MELENICTSHYFRWMDRKKLIELDDAHGRSTVTEQFLLNLHRSSELLKTDQADDARQVLEEAFHSKKDDPSGQATLALVYFKLGLYPRALSLYQKLIVDYPQDPVLMLNLALVHLKLGQTIEAKDILEDLISRHSGYRKAHGYLGLAYQKLGDYKSAFNAFKIGGVDHMAERMSRFIEPEEEIHNDEESSEDSDTPSIPPPPSEAATRQSKSKQDVFVSDVFVATPPFPLRGEDEGVSEPIPISELVRETQLDEALEGRFLISKSGYLLTNVSGKVFAKLEGLHFCSSEGLSYKSLKRRKRGSETNDTFGQSQSPVYDIEGSGRLGFHPRTGVFSGVSLDNDIAYLKEDMIFAFDPELDFENGNLPGGKENVVHFRGRGSVIFRTPKIPNSLQVTPDKGVIIPSGGLVGWFGQLLPRVTQGGPFDTTMNALEFTGEGTLLFCLA